MTTPLAMNFSETELDGLSDWEGRIAVFLTAEGKMDQAARRLNRLAKGASRTLCGKRSVC